MLLSVNISELLYIVATALSQYTCSMFLSFAMFDKNLVCKWFPLIFENNGLILACAHNAIMF